METKTEENKKEVEEEMPEMGLPKILEDREDVTLSKTQLRAVTLIQFEDGHIEAECYGSNIGKIEEENLNEFIEDWKDGLLEK